MGKKLFFKVLNPVADKTYDIAASPRQMAQEVGGTSSQEAVPAGKEAGRHTSRRMTP